MKRIVLLSLLFIGAVFLFFPSRTDAAENIRLIEMAIYNDTGQTYEEIPTADFQADVDVTGLSSTAGKTMILAAYAENGRMVSANYCTASRLRQGTATFSTKIENPDGIVHDLKAIFLSNDGFTPLASALDYREQNAAKVALKTFAETNMTLVDDNGVVTATLPIDIGFTMEPLTTNVENTVRWDMLLWFDSMVNFDIYRRTRTPNIYGDEDISEWTKINGDPVVLSRSRNDPQYLGKSLFSNCYQIEPQSLREDLQVNVEYDYALYFTKIDGVDRSTPLSWNNTVNMKVSVVAGLATELMNFSAGTLTEARLKSFVDDENISVSEIQMPETFPLQKVFTDNTAPTFSDHYPSFYPSDTSVEIQVRLTSPGFVYYAVARPDRITTVADMSESTLTASNTLNIFTVDNFNEGLYYLGKRDGTGKDLVEEWEQFLPLTNPPTTSIYYPNFDSTSGIQADFQQIAGASTVSITVQNLQPETDYFAYFVLRGTGTTYSDQVLLYKFRTTAVKRPWLELNHTYGMVTVRPDMDSTLDYTLMVWNDTTNILLRNTFVSNAMNNAKSSYITDVTLSAEPITLWEHFVRSFATSDYGNKTSAEIAALNYSDITWQQLPADPTKTYGTMNVLDTMNLYYNVVDVGDTMKPGGSLFDRYADDSYKDSILQLVQTSTTSASGGIMDSTRNVFVAENSSMRINYNADDLYSLSLPPAQYCFIVIGRSELCVGNTFRAIYPVQKADQIQPKIEGIAGSVMVEYDSTKRQAQVSEEGIFTVVFTEALYFTDRNDDTIQLKPVIKWPLLDTQYPLPTGFASIRELRTNSPRLIDIDATLTDMEKAMYGQYREEDGKIVYDTIPSPVTSFDVIVQPSTVSDVIVLDRFLSDEYSNIGSRSLTITFSIRTVQEEVKQGDIVTYAYYDVPIVTITSEWAANDITYEVGPHVYRTS